MPGMSAVALPPASTVAPHAPVRWQPWAIGAGALLFVAILAAKFSGPDHAPPVPAPASGPTLPLTTPPPSLPDEIVIATPPLPSEEAGEDWEKIIDKVQDGKLREAKKKLGDWEREHGGATPETEALRTQLDAFPDSDRDRGRGRKKNRD